MVFSCLFRMVSRRNESCIGSQNFMTFHDFPTTLIPQSPGGFLANTTPLVVFSSVSSMLLFSKLPGTSERCWRWEEGAATNIQLRRVKSPSQLEPWPAHSQRGQLRTASVPWVGALGALGTLGTLGVFVVREGPKSVLVSPFQWRNCVHQKGVNPRLEKQATPPIKPQSINTTNGKSASKLSQQHGPCVKSTRL